MSKTLIYLDNSVIGGYYDEIFASDTQAFFERIKNKNFQVFFSNINETELNLAPDHIQEVKSKIPEDCLTYMEVDEESKTL